MAEGPNLNLTPEEKRVFYQLFQAADTTNIGVVTGEVAVSFFEKTNLASDTLGLIWQIADTENRGLLTPSGFGVVLRLIGHAQAGQAPTEELALQPGPLPKFVGLSEGLASRVAEARAATTSPPPGRQPGGSGPIRVTPLNPDDINKFASLFDKSDVQNGLLSGETAKQIFERARLPNEVLGRIWNLSDTKQRGALDVTEFIIAMHLLTSYKTGALKGIPQTLPQGLYDVAARRGSVRSSTGSRASDVPPVPAIPKQFSGSGPQRTQSPVARPPQYGSPLSAQSTGGDWLISPQEKAHFDSIFATIDKAGFGIINGDQAVTFFTNAQLPEETLAQIWDLSDIDSDGQLTKDEFAVAMYLVRQQRNKKEPVPQSLPPALVPPSMRRQAAGATARPAQPPPAAAPVPSATDDLFGLDSFTTPQIPQSTGGSNSPFQPASPTTRTSPPGPSSTFKPFVPSSSFGQSLTPQGTGATFPPSKASPQPSDDLLGDNDPEESKKLTQETTELGNLSNQISSLSNEMQNVQEKRVSAEQEVTQNNQQKRDFEVRLAQARTMYDQEVKNFKVLEERLATSRAETKKLQQDFALIDGSRQDLQTQFNQASAALETDQHENANLKEKIRQANAEVTQLKPQLEKVRSEARQQKGLVAINKKQLATVEGERDRLRDGIDTASRDMEEVDQTATPPAVVASPAASVASQNTNPFFRRTATGSTDNALASSDTTRDKPSNAQSAFDSFFGPSMTTSSASTPPPPPTSFRSESHNPAAPESKAPESSGTTTPSTSPLPVAKEPPPPPQSRQITPSILPLRANSQQSISTTSSVKVSPPASRFGPPSGGSEVEPSVPSTDAASPGATDQNEAESVSNKTQGPPAANAVETDSLSSGSSTSTQPKTLPGSFPEISGSVDTGKNGQTDVSFDELFGGVARERSSSQKAMDFEEAMASMGRKSEPQKSNDDSTQANSSEFPPIREIEDDEDDDSTDSEAPMGFDDDFTAASPPRDKASSPQSKKGSLGDQHLRAFPPVEPAASSDTPLPEADSQASPPSYEKGSTKDESDDFPREFNGLLPNRGDPTSAPDAPHSKETATGDPVIGGVPQHAAATGGDAKRAAPADFEAAFAAVNLAPAEADEDDDDDDDPFESHPNKQSTDLDLSFDSPTSHAKYTPHGNDTGAKFLDFDNNTSGQPPGTVTAGKPNAPNAPTSHDWDELFSNLEAPKKTESGDSDAKESAETPGAVPSPGWALNVDTGEDDQILQRLTSMGYARDESLAALEKFDYNIDKAADFLTSKS